ncbi:hypothetical protein F4780DRAFT_781791 [Xylariomycetidae sp. FL0641]|nr:hypothetical protein F4780DRAFT_781791 [Xylariomycetidae sp. FL0641]
MPQPTALRLLTTVALATATPLHIRQASPPPPPPTSCAALSATAPNWQVSGARSVDWPGGGSGRVELWARHVPTAVAVACDVEYALDAATGAVVGFDPGAAHACANFGEVALNTSVALDMRTLHLTLRGVWTCPDGEEDGEGEEMRWTAVGEVDLQRREDGDGCTVEPSQIGNVTTCNMADVEVLGRLEAGEA